MIFTTIENRERINVGFTISKNGRPISLSRISELPSRLRTHLSSSSPPPSPSPSSWSSLNTGAAKARGGKRADEAASDGNLVRVSARAVGPALTSHLTLAGRLFYLIRDLRMRTGRPRGIPSAGRTAILGPPARCGYARESHERRGRCPEDKSSALSLPRRPTRRGTAVKDGGGNDRDA